MTASPEGPFPLDRRLFLRGALAGGAAIGLGFPRFADASQPQASPQSGLSGHLQDALENSAVGMYTDPSVAGQASCFTLNRSMISCGVGTIAIPDGGPFAMLMFATEILTFAVLRERGELRARGRMRSITRMATQTVEDVEHDFLAVAVDGHGRRPSRFDVHFKTPFWTPGQNVMATRSSEDPSLARFGGEVLIGSIRVSR